MLVGSVPIALKGLHAVTGTASANQNKNSFDGLVSQTRLTCSDAKAEVQSPRSPEPTFNFDGIRSIAVETGPNGLDNRLVARFKQDRYSAAVEGCNLEVKTDSELETGRWTFPISCSTNCQNSKTPTVLIEAKPADG